MTDEKPVTILVAPRVNTTGFLVVVYRNAHGEIVTMGVNSLDDAVSAITACLQYQFSMDGQEAAALSQQAIDRYASGIIAIEEADALSVALQDQLESAERLVKRLSGELDVARDELTTQRQTSQRTNSTE